MDYNDDYDVSIELIIGKRIESVANEKDESIIFVCDDGDAFEAHHMQDCCESVLVHDIVGDLQDLVGKKITAASGESSDQWPADVPKAEYTESFTWTTHVFTGDDGTTVRVRWLGESNGYYSESVYFGRTHKPIKVDG